MVDYPKQDRVLRLPRTRVGGRTITGYDPAMALRIVEAIAEGETLSEICTAAKGNCARSTFYRWVVMYPQVRAAYDAARELSANAFEEEAIDLTRARVKKPLDQQHLRAAELHVGQLRWSAARRNPRVFSERGTLNVTVPIQINTTLNLGDDPTQGVEEVPDIYKIDLEAVVPRPQDEGSGTREEGEVPPLLPEPNKGVPVLRGGRGGAPSAAEMKAKRQAYKERMERTAQAKKKYGDD